MLSWENHVDTGTPERLLEVGKRLEEYLEGFPNIYKGRSAKQVCMTIRIRINVLMFPKGKAIAPFQLVVPTGMLKITNLDQSPSCSKTEPLNNYVAVALAMLTFFRLSLPTFGVSLGVQKKKEGIFGEGYTSWSTIP